MDRAIAPIHAWESFRQYSNRIPLGLNLQARLGNHASLTIRSPASRNSRSPTYELPVSAGRLQHQLYCVHIHDILYARRDVLSTSLAIFALPVFPYE